MLPHFALGGLLDKAHAKTIVSNIGSSIVNTTSIIALYVKAAAAYAAGLFLKFLADAPRLSCAFSLTQTKAAVLFDHLLDLCGILSVRRLNYFFR